MLVWSGLDQDLQRMTLRLKSILSDRLLELRCSLTHCSCEWECRVTPSPPHVVAPRKISERQTELSGVWYDAEYIVPLTLLELHADYEWLLWWSAKCLLQKNTMRMRSLDYGLLSVVLLPCAAVTCLVT